MGDNMVLVDYREFDSHKFYLLIHKIKQNKKHYSHLAPDQIEDHDKMLFHGPRYSDNERIARMVVGEIYKSNDFNIEKANKAFLAMNSVDMESIIIDCVNDSAAADYWNIYEKN